MSYWKMRRRFISGKRVYNCSDSFLWWYFWNIWRLFIAVNSIIECYHFKGICANCVRVFWIQHQHVLSFVYQLICSILYQRGLYPPDYFSRVQKYGLPMVIAKQEDLYRYISNMVSQVKGILVTWIITFSLDWIEWPSHTGSCDLRHRQSASAGTLDFWGWDRSRSCAVSWIRYSRERPQSNPERDSSNYPSDNCFDNVPSSSRRTM